MCSHKILFGYIPEGIDKVLSKFFGYEAVHFNFTAVLILIIGKNKTGSKQFSGIDIILLQKFFKFFFAQVIMP